MHVLFGDKFTQSVQPAVSHISLSSVIINENITSFDYPGRRIQLVQWMRNEAEMRRHDSTIWLMLPISSIIITSIVILLMVMYNRCPQMVASIITGILGTIIVFIVVMVLNQRPIYS